MKKLISNIFDTFFFRSADSAFFFCLEDGQPCDEDGEIITYQNGELVYPRDLNSNENKIIYALLCAPILLPLSAYIHDYTLIPFFFISFITISSVFCFIFLRNVGNQRHEFKVFYEDVNKMNFRCKHCGYFFRQRINDTMFMSLISLGCVLWLYYLGITPVIEMNFWGTVLFFILLLFVLVGFPLSVLGLFVNLVWRLEEFEKRPDWNKFVRPL